MTRRRERKVALGRRSGGRACQCGALFPGDHAGACGPSQEVPVVDELVSLTSRLNLRTYGEPVIHATSGQGKSDNEGFDGFVPLIDSGIYIAVWVKPRFFSTILYTCADFDEDHAVQIVRDVMGATEHEAAIF
jgi:S-adenosylmethionine decarboxylase